MLHLNLSFGDSLADIGNLVHLSAQSNEPPPHFGLPPYKETYFHGPTARCSDGRLVVITLVWTISQVSTTNTCNNVPILLVSISSFVFQLSILDLHFYHHMLVARMAVEKGLASFGDSLADTGNQLHLLDQSNKPPPNFAFPPYGETYYDSPTGRCSDGRLIIDFIAQYYGLPFVPAYVGGKNASSRSFLKGVNFAVAGATTALDVVFFEERGVHNAWTNVSLGVQLGLFKQLLPSLCQTSSGKPKGHLYLWTQRCDTAAKHRLSLKL
ncbi:hypothetical protein RJ640_017299 [Escallonia rubra]|uniref:GDSL esterase/lipase n=1 Tax=Escallonia rubra TaxID=112253 RepID=A0AA88SMM0_9ASTE|nr:hypothetical protein RJ640_017299 [Escallonia rubra]